MARWKSGLLPLVVFASRVNCDTQSTSPSMSLTLERHIRPEPSSNTFSERLHAQSVSYCLQGHRKRHAHILLVRVAMSVGVSSILSSGSAAVSPRLNEDV